MLNLAKRPLFSWSFILLFHCFLFSHKLIAANVKELGNGEHSFRALGSDFYVELPVRTVQGAKLSLFSTLAAERIGLEVPKNLQNFESQILEQLAVMVSPKETSSRTMIATRYQDSPRKLKGDPLGDGRAVWSGELKIADADGIPFYVDVVIKGVGKTPLAWTNHPKKSHKDGLVSMVEAVQSFVHSEANILNGLDSTMDLAVIELPITKTLNNGENVTAALSVRVGNQFRLGHLRYFQNNHEKFKKIFEYIARRDLHMPKDSPVTKRDEIPGRVHIKPRR